MEIDMNENNWATPCPKYDCKKTACKCGLEYVNIPTSLGDDSEGSNVAPKNGAYCNALVFYEANGHVYIYTKEGIPTLIDVDASDISTLEQEVRKAQKDIVEFREDVDRFAYFFDTVANMKASPQLSSGDYVRTLGYYTKDDGGGAYYKVSSTQPSGYYETLGNMSYAELVPQEDIILTKQFGIIGDGATDETAKLQQFFSYDANNYIINSPSILIDGDMSITSNSSINFNEGCKIIRKTNSLNHYYMLLLDNVHDVKISNAHLIGDRETHTGNDGEWGHGINIVCSNNITVENSHIEYTWGDGIYVGLYTTSGSTNEVKNITINKCHINNCSRNGISVCSGSNISITDCFIEYTNRTWPKAGIDIEPEGPSGSTPAINGLTINSLKTSNNTDGILVAARTALVNGLVINNHYSIKDGTGFAISRFGNSGNTLLYKNAYIELARTIPIIIDKENTNMITIKDIICDSTTRTNTPTDYYGLINLDNPTDEDFGGIVFDNIQGVENHTGNNYQMYTNVICRNGSSSGKIVNIILKNTNDIITTRTPRRLMYLYGTNYDFSTIKIINCNSEFSSNYYQLDFNRGCNMKKLKASSLGDNSTVNVTDVLADGIYEVELLNRNTYRQEVIFDASYNVYHGDGTITTLDYRKMRTTANGSYLKFEKQGQNIIVLANNGYTPMQVS